MTRSPHVPRAVLALALLVSLASAPPPVQATSFITDSDFVGLLEEPPGSGRGLLDLTLFTHSGGGSENASGGFDGDDANLGLPTGNTPADSIANESYVTSFGDIRAFYDLNFDPGAVNEMTLFVDINETGTVNDITLSSLEFVLNYDTTFGDDRDVPWEDGQGNPVDVSSELQGATGSSFTLAGGILLAALDAAKVLPMLNQGGGAADYMIFTGVNPFDEAFLDDSRLLINWQSLGHDNGGEAVFLSGVFSPIDVVPGGGDPASAPEPATIALLGTALAGLAGLKRRKRRA